MVGRVRLPPFAADKMDVGARKWMIKTARQNFWRVAAWLELEDLIQDGYLLWISTRRRYSCAVMIPHVMRLFQVTYINHIHDLSRKARYCTEIALSQFDDVVATAIIHLQACHFSELLRLMAEAPDDIKAILQSMHTRDFAYRERHRGNGTALTPSERMAKAAGLPLGRKYSTELHAYLKC